MQVDGLGCNASHYTSAEPQGKIVPDGLPVAIKKPAFYAGLVEVLGRFRMLSDDLNGGPETNQKSPEPLDSNRVSEI